MARLPSRFDLSGQPSLRSGRQLAEFDTSGIGRGLASLGGAVSDIGADLSRQRGTVDLARAEAHKTQGFIDAENEFSQDGDYSTFGRRAPERTGKIVNEAANLIRDPELRERWRIGAQTDAARANDSIADRGRALGKQAETVAFDDALEVNRRIYVDPNTADDAKAKARQDIEGAISTAEQSGLLTPEQAASRRDQYVKNADFSRAKLEADTSPGRFVRHSVVESGVPPEGAALLDTIAGTESPGYNVLNGGERFSSYADHPRRVGKGGTATAAGRYQFVKGTWDRAQTATGVPDFSPASQDKAAWWLAQNDYKANTGRDLLTDLRSKDPNTIAGVRKALASTWEGLKSLDDNRFNAKLEAGPVTNPGYFENLSPEQRQVVYNQAESRQREIAVEQRGAIDSVVQNAPVAIQNTGAYDGQLPTAQNFVDAYGVQEGSERYAKFSAALDVSQQAYDFRTMSADDIEAAVDQARPISSGDDAALETARYDTLSKAAASTLAARNADPATYARQTFPSVNRAWEEAPTTGNYQQAMAASANAQQQLGIEKMRLMPKETADKAITTFKDANLPEDERINAVTGLVFSTPDATQRRAVFEQLVDAGLPDATEGAIEAYARGDQGAGRRLMEAAIIDPSKLPGTTNLKPAEIDAEIQAKIMDEGQIGDIFYGLSDGTIENQERAIRDSKLLTNAVNLRVRNGETLDAAINGAAKDLYGDVKPVSGGSEVNAQVLIPADSDANAVLSGLAGLMSTVRTELERHMVVPNASSANGEKAITEAVRANYMENVLAEGYFRNAGDGYVFIDPYVGAAIAGADGQPRIFSDGEVLAAQRPGANLAPPEVDNIPQNRLQTPEEVIDSEYGKFGALLKEMEE